MSVYLGQEKVGVSYATNTANMYNIDRSIMSDTIYTPWVRPEGWPDLDSLNLEMSGQESFIYMTYRTGHVDDFCAFHLNRASNTSATVSLGTITNGEFVADSSETFSSNSDVRYWFTSNEGYSDGTIVVRITGRITGFWLLGATRDASLGGGTLVALKQSLLERIAYIPEVISFNGTSIGSYTLERDKIGNGTGAALTSLYYTWYRCYNLQSLDLSEFYTPNVTTMNSAFCMCRLLEELDIAHFNTSKVTTFYSMFDGCIRLKSLDLRNWETPVLINLNYTFRSCQAIQEIKGLAGFNTTKVTSLNNTFGNCYNLKDLSGVTNWDVSAVTILTGTFNLCSSIKQLDLSKWNVSKVTNIAGLFSQCNNLEKIFFPIVITNTLTGGNAQIFYNCYNLQEINFNWIKPITNAVTNIGYLCYGCRSVKEINIPEGWDVTGCTASESFFRLFGYCYKLEKITGISNWDASNYNYSMNYMFAEDHSLKELDIKNWCPHPTTLYYAFNNCFSLESLDLTGWHWENMTGTALQATFGSCYSLKEIKGIEHMGDSGNITNMGSLFSACYSLTSIPTINSWNLEKVTTITYMFNECRSLRSISISGWSLPKCTTIDYLFANCSNLRELELTNWSLTALTTAPTNIFINLYNLQKCSGLPINLNHNYRNALGLPESEWIRIFNQLPTVSNKTITMTTENINRLSSTTKAIATNKGWTLAN